MTTRLVNAVITLTFLRPRATKREVRRLRLQRLWIDAIGPISPEGFLG
jgi:hypothetical protein